MIFCSLHWTQMLHYGFEYEILKFTFNKYFSSSENVSPEVCCHECIVFHFGPLIL